MSILEQDNINNTVNKIYGFSEIEFRLLLDVYEMHELRAFEGKLQFETAQEKETACKNAIFSLYKKGYIELSESAENIILCRDIAHIFTLISECRICVAISDGESGYSTTCIYVGNGDECAVAEPGVRDKEFMRLRFIKKESFEEYFKETGILFDRLISAETEKMLKVEPEDLVGGKVVNEFIFTEKNSNKEIKRISVVEYPLFDRILIHKDGETKDFPMDNEMIISSIYEVV